MKREGETPESPLLPIKNFLKEGAMSWVNWLSAHLSAGAYKPHWGRSIVIRRHKPLVRLLPQGQLLLQRAHAA